MQNLILITCFISGAVSGVVIGMLTAGLFTQRAIIRKERETWTAATKFHELQAKL